MPISIAWTTPGLALLATIGASPSELDVTAERRALEDEMGDILFAAANLARKLDIDPEAALRRATAKFEGRFRRVETLAAEGAVGSDLDSLDALWQQVKREEGEKAKADAFPGLSEGRASGKRSGRPSLE